MIVSNEQTEVVIFLTEQQSIFQIVFRDISKRKQLIFSFVTLNLKRIQLKKNSMSVFQTHFIESGLT